MTIGADEITTDGDRELKKFLDPLLRQAGTNKEQNEQLSTLNQDVMEVVGQKLWSSAISSNWKHREAAATAFLNYLEPGLPERYQRDTKPLFRACI